MRLARLQGIKIKGELDQLFFHSSETELERPFYASPIQAGFPSPTEPYIERTVDLNRDLIKNPATTFYARVANNSMEPVIHDGAIVIFDSSLEVRHGHTTVAVLDGDFCIKRYHETSDGGIWLCSENELYKPIVITQEMDFRLRGRVIGAIHLL